MTTSAPSAPLHPGSLLMTKFLEPLKVSVSDAAAVMGVAAQDLEDFVAGRRSVDTELSYRLEFYVGDAAGDWLHRQLLFDLAAKPAPAFSGPKLESAYWGTFVGIFKLTADLSAEKSVTAIVAMAFAEDGTLNIVLAEGGAPGGPKVSFHFEHPAFAVFKKLLSKRSPVELLEGVPEAFEYVRARLFAARTEIGSNRLYLQNVSQVARVCWMDYSQENGLAEVIFHDNSPSWTHFHRDKGVSVMGQTTFDAIRAVQRSTLN